MKTLNIKRGQQSGFTLIELIAVIVILGILAAIAVPKFTGLNTAAQTAADSYSTAASKTGAEVTAAGLTGVTVGNL